jgi:putative addiction module component (TIGR02574 family)
MKLTQAEIDAMPIEEKLELSEALWESIYASPDELPIPDWHKALLDESLKDFETHPDEGSSWPEVKARLQKDS